MARPVVDHVALAVPSLGRALAFFEELGLQADGVEEIPSDQIRMAMIPIGPMCLEVMETTDPLGPVGRFLERRGPGFHHLAIRVDDLEDTLHALAERGVRLVDQAPRPGSNGTSVGFVHPEGTGGALVELVERRDDD